MKHKAFFALATLVPTLALADPLVETRTPNNQLSAAPSQWLGKTPHFVMMGEASGYVFDVQIMKLKDASIRNLAVKREYLKSGTSYNPYREIDVNLEVVLEGVAKTIETKLTYSDFSKLASLPANFNVQSFEEFPAGNRIFTELEFQWEGGGKAVDKELADWRGKATLNHDDGRLADQPNADGMVGGYINSKRGRDNMIISFYLPVSEFEIDD